MLSELTQLVQQVAGEYMQTDNGLDNKHNDTAMGLASSSIMQELQNQLSNGNAQQVMGLLSGQQQIASGNPIVNNIVENLAGNLMEKLGVNHGTAQTIALTVVPMVMQQLVSKTNNPNDNSFNLQGILGGLLGNNTHAGGFDISSLLNMVGGGNNNNSNQGGGDLLGGLLNNFLGGK